MLISISNSLEPAVSCKHSLVMWAVGYTSPTYCCYLRNPSSMDYYSFNRPRRDGWLSWPCWLTDSGCCTHKVVTRPAFSLAQDRESLPARTGGLTTMLCRQLSLVAGQHEMNPACKTLALTILNSSSQKQKVVALIVLMVARQ